MPKMEEHSERKNLKSQIKPAYIFHSELTYIIKIRYFRTLNKERLNVQINNSICIHFGIKLYH